MLMNTTQVTFDANNMVVAIERGMCCPKLITPVLIVMRLHHCFCKNKNATGIYQVSYDENSMVSGVDYQVRGHYDIVQGQFYDWKPLDK